MLDQARTLYPLVARDLVAGLAARESLEDTLEYLARRRAPLYANPRGGAAAELYWPAFAAALAPDAPPTWMPMAGLVEQGITLEGGAKGLRGLFTREPSEKERRKVIKTATLVARILEIIASRDAQLSAEEARLVAMTMGSFGLTADELIQTRPAGALTYESLEIFGDLDARTRRELVRGAWQLAMVDRLEPPKELAVRAIAARLECSAECDQIRAEVVAQIARQSEMAVVAVELVRGPAQMLAPQTARPWLEHLIMSAAPAARRAELMETALGPASVAFETMPRLDASRRRQAAALALATLLGHDPPNSVALRLRASLRAACTVAAIGSEFADALALVDRFLFERMRDIAPPAPPEEAAAGATNASGAQPGAAAATNPATAPTAPGMPPAAPVPKPPVPPGGAAGSGGPAS